MSSNWPFFRGWKGCVIRTRRNSSRGLGAIEGSSKDAAGEWIGIEFFAAQLDQGIDTIAPIDCLNGN
jgi:hypothetical protein